MIYATMTNKLCCKNYSFLTKIRRLHRPVKNEFSIEPSLFFSPQQFFYRKKNKWCKNFSPLVKKNLKFWFSFFRWKDFFNFTGCYFRCWGILPVMVFWQFLVRRRQKSDKKLARGSSKLLVTFLLLRNYILAVLFWIFPCYCQRRNRLDEFCWHLIKKTIFLIGAFSSHQHR